MVHRRPRKPPQPLDEAKLRELALAYVGRFATTRAKLRAYLSRKMRERGWSGGRPADVPALVEAIAALGYVDDASFALSKAHSLTARGYGVRRVIQSLRAAGVEDDDGIQAREHAAAEAVSAALRFAERRRIGPFATEPKDPRDREKAIAAMIRAGHGFGLARAIAEIPPGTPVDTLELAEHVRTGAA